LFPIRRLQYNIGEGAWKDTDNCGGRSPDKISFGDKRDKTASQKIRSAFIQERDQHAFENRDVASRIRHCSAGGGAGLYMSVIRAHTMASFATVTWESHGCTGASTRRQPPK
jgi:hypothetical protein